MRAALFLFLFSLSIPRALNAQGHLEIPRYEAGLQIDISYLNGVGDWGGGVGGRFHYNFDEHFAFDSELTYRQHNVAGLMATVPVTVGQTTGLFGLRGGKRFERGGFFLRARGGFLHFGSYDGVRLLSRNTVPAFDLGGTLEHYMGPVILRVDLGEMIVPYRNTTVSPGPFVLPPPPSSLRLGTQTSPALGFGFAFRF